LKIIAKWDVGYQGCQTFGGASQGRQGSKSRLACKEMEAWEGFCTSFMTVFVFLFVLVLIFSLLIVDTLHF